MLNKRFGMLIGIASTNRRSKSREIYWKFKCDCGNEIEAVSAAIKSGATYNCGCIDRTTHGMSYTRTYKTFASMWERCTNKNAKEWPRYGARGIKVCKRWNKFENFFADMGERPNGKTLDRIDGTKGYSPNNCRWATVREQANNTKKNRRYNIAGKNMTISEIASMYGFKYMCLYNRLERGYSIEEAVDDSTMQRKRERTRLRSGF